MKSIPKSWLIKPDEEETMHLIRELEKVYKEYYKNDDHSEVIKKIKRLGELGYPRSIEVLKKIAETFSAFHIYDVAEAAKEAIEIIKDSKRNFLSKLIRRLLTPKPKSYEICTACGRKLDISEQAYVHKERIVCGNCNTRKREDEEETKRKLVEAQELMKQGNPFDARLILGRYDFRCETELWRQLGECFERKGLLRSAIMVYSRCGHTLGRDQIAARLGLTGHSCDIHKESQAIGKCESCQGYFCTACGDEWANHFACKSCLAQSRREWMSQARWGGFR